MNFYRLTYLKNEIISCVEAIDIANELPYFEHRDGQVIFAIVAAEDPADANRQGRELVALAKKTMERKDEALDRGISSR